MVIIRWFYIFLIFVSFSCFSNFDVVKTNINSDKYILEIVIDHDLYFYFDSNRYHVQIIDRNQNKVRVSISIKDNNSPKDLFVNYFEKEWKSKKINFEETLKRKPEDLNADILVEIDKQKVRYGEGVVVKYSLISKQSYLNYRISKFPAYEGFLKRFLDPGNFTKPIKENGVVKYLTPLYFVELFPMENVDKKILDMEIVVNENSANEYFLKSINPNFTYFSDNSFDPYSDINVEMPNNLNLDNEDNNFVEFKVKIHGRGMLENITTLDFSGDIISKSLVTLIDQKYRPGYAEKIFKIRLFYYLNKSGQIKLGFGGKVRRAFQIDSFVGKTIKNDYLNLENKLLFSLINFPKYILYFIFIFTLISFIFPFWIINQIKVSVHLIKLYLSGIFPISSYESLIRHVFLSEKYGFYFIQNLGNLNPKTNELKLILRKINLILNNYGKNDKNIVKLSFWEITRLIIFLNKEGLWKF